MGDPSSQWNDIRLVVAGRFEDDLAVRCRSLGPEVRILGYVSDEVSPYFVRASRCKSGFLRRRGIWNTGVGSDGFWQTCRVLFRERDPRGCGRRGDPAFLPMRRPNTRKQSLPLCMIRRCVRNTRRVALNEYGFIHGKQAPNADRCFRRCSRRGGLVHSLSIGNR